MKIFINIIAEEFFHSFFFSFLFLLLIETSKKGFVSHFFNLNYLLAVILISGFMMIITEPQKKVTYIKQATESDWLNVLIISLIGGFLVFEKTKQLGKISLIVSIFTVFFIFFLSALIFIESSMQGETFSIALLKRRLPISPYLLNFLVQLDIIDRLTFYKILHSVYKQEYSKKHRPITKGN
ncbi:hypothetical protein HZA76_02945 [Candidatus Roizmanbacteria bacterium]|nr:hypothetical protein [Candidatus Roizmanbacteria bacterium]